MELNKEIRQILLDSMDLAQVNKWTKEEKEIRSVYDTFRIQNIVKKLNYSS